MKLSNRVRFKHENASALLSIFDPQLGVLSNLWSTTRGQGHGRKVMQKLVDYADENELTINLVAQQYGVSDGTALNNRQLMEFYKEFGFERSGTSAPVSMSRQPRGVNMVHNETPTEKDRYV